MPDTAYEKKESPHVLVERDGPVVIVTLNRPETRNAMDLESFARMADAWQLIDSDPEVRVAILTGAGGHFSSGSDLKFMAGGQAAPQWTKRFEDDPELHWKSLLRSYRLKKPLIAAVEGTCIAGGTEILQATDIRIAGATAKFGVSEARWGLFPLGGSTVRLRRQIPYCRAMDILLTGRHVTAEEALEIGLIGRIVPAGEALTEAKRVAALVAENGPLAVQAIKRSVLETEGLPEKEALAKELEIGW
ncbi:MAG TPA: crotonase/enoyl-CoA hydratase family protein, partial [Polyangiaceae bacterium]